MQFGFEIVVGVDDHLHVLRPYADHFSRRDACGCGRCFKGPIPLGSAEYVLDRRSGRMLWGA